MVKAATTRVEDDASAKIFRGTYTVGKRGICQRVSAGNLRKTIFDTFPLPYSNLAYL